MNRIQKFVSFAGLLRPAPDTPPVDPMAAWHADQRQRALVLLNFHRAQIGNAPHYQALTHAHGVAAGYLKAVFEAGLLLRDEAIEENNAIAIAVNLRMPALMMDVIDTRVVH